MCHRFWGVQGGWVAGRRGATTTNFQCSPATQRVRHVTFARDEANMDLEDNSFTLTRTDVQQGERRKRSISLFFP